MFFGPSSRAIALIVVIGEVRKNELRGLIERQQTGR
jgi:hypothetical protein